MKKLASVLLVLLMVLSFAACGKKSVEKQLVGSWYESDEDVVLTFENDGTCSLRSADDFTVEWRVVDGDMLELTRPDGSELTLIIDEMDEDSLTLYPEGFSDETLTFWRIDD